MRDVNDMRAGPMSATARFFVPAQYGFSDAGSVHFITVPPRCTVRRRSGATGIDRLLLDGICKLGFQMSLATGFANKRMRDST
jgi:hypothetical protein